MPTRAHPQGARQGKNGQQTNPTVIQKQQASNNKSLVAPVKQQQLTELFKSGGVNGGKSV